MRLALHHDITHFDAIGDIHGCYAELTELVRKLGYSVEDGLLSHPEGRTLVLLGDLTDRGPFNADVFEFVHRNWVEERLLWVMGNHDDKLLRWMKGNDVTVAHGLGVTIVQMIRKYSADALREMGGRLHATVPHKIELDGGSVIAVHAAPGLDKDDCLYGPRDKIAKTREAWWPSWKGPEFVLFGHYWLDDPEPDEYWCCLDTSCCRGGALTALRWPERSLVQIPARADYDGQLHAG